MKTRAAFLAGMGVLASSLTYCVGDSTVVPDAGGNDATTDVSNDVANETGPTDAGGDGDAAAANKHAYVASFTGAVYVYDQPVTSTSTPAVVLKANFNTPADVEIVPGGLQLLVVDVGAKKVSIFDLPITQTSVATTTISLDFMAVDAAFDQQGNLYLGGFGTKMEKFTPPFANNSQPSQTFTIPQADAFGIAINNNNTLFVGASGHVMAFATPFDAGAPTPFADNTQTAGPTGIALNPNGVFVSSFGAGIVNEYAAPLQSNETPTALGGSFLGNPVRAKFFSGNLVVADVLKGLVMLDSPSFTTSSISVPNNPDAGIANMRAVTFGP